MFAVPCWDCASDVETGAAGVWARLKVDVPTIAANKNGWYLPNFVISPPIEGIKATGPSSSSRGIRAPNKGRASRPFVTGVKRMYTSPTGSGLRDLVQASDYRMVTMSTTTTDPQLAIAERFRAARQRTRALCTLLTPEDMMVQSCPEASPAKWHLAHTAWFFESFILAEFAPGYRVFNPDFA